MFFQHQADGALPEFWSEYPSRRVCYGLLLHHFSHCKPPRFGVYKSGARSSPAKAELGIRIVQRKRQAAQRRDIFFLFEETALHNFT